MLMDIPDINEVKTDFYHLTPPKKKNPDGSLITNGILANCL